MGKAMMGGKIMIQTEMKKLLCKGLKVVRIKNEELVDINNVIAIIKEIIKNQVLQLSDIKQNATPSLNFKGRGRGKGLITKSNE